MSIQSRRNALFKSSISIKSIGDSIQKFSEGLRSARKNADETIKTSRQKNIFKSKLIRNDNLFFRKRQENIKRKDREDELEASSTQGVPKTQGSILAKSTRGFLGRMLDFIGILLIGWAIQNLPKIISGINGLIKRISSVTGILSLFVDGIKFVLGGIGTLLQNAISSLLRFDFLTQKKEVESGLESANSGLAQARNELNTAASEFQQPESYGLPNPPGFDLDNKQEAQSKDDAKGDLSMGDGLGAQEPSGLPELKKQISDKLEEGQEEEEDEVVQGDAEDVEGVQGDLESFLTESESGSGGGGGSSASPSGGANVADPTDELKKKQKEALSYPKRNTGRNRNRNRSSSFLGTPDSVDNISQSVTPESSTMLASVGTYDPDFEGGQDGSRKVNLSSLVNPSKKEVNIKTDRKSKNKVMIIEKPMQTASSGGGGMSGGGSSSSIPEVNDEKLLMKMQSTSTLKYT